MLIEDALPSISNSSNVELAAKNSVSSSASDTTTDDSCDTAQRLHNGSDETDIPPSCDRKDDGGDSQQGEQYATDMTHIPSADSCSPFSTDAVPMTSASSLHPRRLVKRSLSSPQHTYRRSPRISSASLSQMAAPTTRHKVRKSRGLGSTHRRHGATSSP